MFEMDDDAAHMVALRVLGLPAGASWPQTTERYHQLLFQTHPDHHATEPADGETTKQMMDITAAYRTLRQDHGSKQGAGRDHRHQDRQGHVRTRDEGTTRRPRPMSVDWSTMPRVRPSIVAGPVIISPGRSRGRER